jgi:integrase/recombinase XerC
MNSYEDWLMRFSAWLLIERRLSQNTEKNYAIDLTKFFAYLREKNVHDVRFITEHHVRGFAATTHADGCDTRTVQRRLSAVRTFFDFLILEQIESRVGANPGRLVKAPRITKTLPNVASAEQMARLLDIPPDDDPIVVRDVAIMETLYSSVVRLSELIGLNVDDVFLSDGTVFVRGGKGDRDRYAPIGSHACRALEAWLAVREKLAPPADQGALFISTRRVWARLSARQVQMRVAFWAKVQKVGCHLHPHIFRHAGATHVLESSHNLRQVQELLGHASIMTTQMYTHLDVAHLADVYFHTHPRARRTKDT